MVGSIYINLYFAIELVLDVSCHDFEKSSGIAGVAEQGGGGANRGQMYASRGQAYMPGSKC